MMDKVKRTTGIRLMMFYDFLTIAKLTEYLTDYNSCDEPSSRSNMKKRARATITLPDIKIFSEVGDATEQEIWM